MALTDIELRSRIRELIASGDLPSDPPVIHRAGDGAGGARRQDVCSICTEPDPTVSYFWPGGVVVRLHASCDAVWKQERGG